MRGAFENDFDNDKFKLLKQVLSTGLSSLKQDLQTQSVRVKKPDSWYLSRELPKAILKPQKRKKQGILAARHILRGKAGI